jgi:hypothetical protein
MIAQIDLTQERIANHLFRPLRFLGAVQYIKFFVGSVLWKLKALRNPCSVFRNRIRLTVNRRPLTVNLRKIDTFCRSIEGEGDGFSAGIIAEMYFQNTYLKFYDGNLDDLGTVLDLGGNRGFFSLFMSQFARKVIWVECRRAFSDVLDSIASENRIDNIVKEKCNVGGDGLFSKFNENTKSIQQIMTDNGVTSIDFLKIDIEGSEFDLFKETGFLQHTKYIGMEVHPEFGAPNAIATTLQANGFKTKMVDERFLDSTERHQIVYLFAENQSLQP